MNSYAPITLFVYNRLSHVKNVVQSLKRNVLATSSELIIYSDGPKNEKDSNKIYKIRKYLKEIKGFKNVKIIERSKNYGLSKNVINGVSTIVKKYKKIIVVEDDLVVNKYFLKYMNNNLNLYEKDKKVASIHGYVYPIKNIKNKIHVNSFFIKGADCWGWATWLRAWKNFDKNGERLLKKINKQKKIKEFNFNDTYNYYQMLKDQVSNKNDSWAIRWYASSFLKNMLTLYPTSTYVKNIGIDRTGKNSNLDLLNLGNKRLYSVNHKIKKQSVEESQIVRKMFEEFFKNKKIFKIKNLIKNFLNV